jgi:hypothetical protein
MGLLKNEIFFPNYPIQTNYYTDLLNFYRFNCRMLSAEELNAFYWPQLFLVSDSNLSTEVFPDLLNLS